MCEYELYKRILAPKLMPNQQDVLQENLRESVHRVTIIPDKRISYSLYRYDQKEQREQFFPFFNNIHDDTKYHAPIDLLKFCDYILLAERQHVLYVLLLELKSGGNDDAYKQLDASAAFMEYIKQTAMRIAKINNYSNFDKENIKVRKIILKPAPKTRPLTNKAKSRGSRIDLKASPIYYPSDVLPLHLFCKE